MSQVKQFRFLDFPVYKESQVLYKEIVILTRPFPRVHWELADQLRRCCLSVCLNIAEGSAKYSDKEFKRFLEMSSGSLSEAVACLNIALENNIVSNEQFEKYLELATIIGKQLGGLIKKLRSTT